MATLTARRLTESHRLAQARLGAITVARMRALWALLDPEALDSTFDRWLLAALPVIQGQRSTSARLAGNYLAAFKALELGVSARPVTVLDETADPSAVTTSLLVTGPLSIKRAMGRGVPIRRAVDVAQAASSAAAMRHVLDGGRRTITDTVRADRQALGWARVTSGNSCPFCSLLAGRGAVYGEASADFEAHDGCSCSAEPVYRP